MNRFERTPRTETVNDHKMLYELTSVLPIQPFELVALLDLPDGLCLEFGVASGASTCILHRLIQKDIYGFDSFEGMPEDWGTALKRGDFAGIVPRTEEGIHLITGWIEHTLPPFLEQHQGPIALANIDVDIYSTTKFILEKIEPRLVKGSIIMVDDLTDFSPCLEHQCKAWFEFVSGTKKQWEVVCRYSRNGVMFRKA